MSDDPTLTLAAAATAYAKAVVEWRNPNSTIGFRRAAAMLQEAQLALLTAALIANGVEP